MADRRTVAFTRPQVQQLRTLLHVTRDETAGGGVRRRTAAGVSTKYSGQFAVTDITDYSPLDDDPPGEVEYKLNMLGGQAHFLNRVNTVAEREEVEFEWESETVKYLVLEFSLDGATVVVEEKVLTLAETQAALGADEGRLVIAKLTLADSRVTVEQIQFGSATVVSRAKAFYIARTTARTADKTYTVDIYTGYTATGTIDVANRIEENAVMITPNLNDTATVDQLPNGTNLAVMVGNYANPDYDPENPEAEPERITRYFPIEHVGLI
jgi:hypothetical protein